MRLLIWRRGPLVQSLADARPAARSRFREPVTFGLADGLTVLLGVMVSLEGDPRALWKAAVGAGLAELVGMTAGQWLSDGQSGFPPALANGTAACAACILPAVPWLAGGGPLVLASSLVLVASAGCVISLLRPERGALAFATTFGILAVAAGLCWAASLA